MIDPADVETPEAVVGAVYRILSGRAVESRDWAALDALCLAGARVMPVSVADGSVLIETFDIAGYAASRTPMLAANDFYEREVERRVDRSANIAQVWSSYEARRSQHGPAFMRGVGSFQLVHRDGRWWIVSAIWQAESRGEGH